MLPLTRQVGWFHRLLLTLTLILFFSQPPLHLPGAELARRPFALPAADAEVTLETFSDQAGAQLVYLIEDVRGVTTHPVQGTFAIRDALERLVAHTELKVEPDGKTGAYVIRRVSKLRAATEAPQPTNQTITQSMRKSPRTLLAVLTAWVAAGAVADAQTVATPPKDEAVVLSPFNVTSDRDYGYVATNTLAGTRVNTPVKDVGAQISIFTQDFIKDVGATNLEELMGYAIGTQQDLTEESATAGIFNSSGLKNPVSSFRVRGITGVGRARNYFTWSGGELDFSTTDRVDFSRGPNSILFGLGSPAGMAHSRMSSKISSERKHHV